MFTLLGRFVARAWPWLLLLWVGLLAGTWAAAPPWKDVAKEGEFAFLPPGAPSRRSEAIYHRAFPGQSGDSSVVVVLHRDAGQQGIRDSDREFITRALKPGIERIAERSKRWPSHVSRTAQAGEAEAAGPAGPPVIRRIRTPQDPGIGALLVSPDGRAALVIAELSVNFFERRSQRAASEVENLVQELRRGGKVPEGLAVGLTGSAVVGRDINQSKSRSARAIQAWTIWIVIGLLLLVYRAPLLALIPLVTLFFAVKVALGVLALLGRAGLVGLFSGLEVYTTVLVYGAGVDYSLFLIARQREELNAGQGGTESVAQALAKVGHAVTASGATVILGIGMLAFAEFGKFHEAGIAVALALLVMMAAVLTFAPALLCLAGRWAFWPHAVRRTGGGWFNWARFTEKVWERVGYAIERRPATIWVLVVAALSPFAAVALRDHGRLNYGLLTELSGRMPSVRGTRDLERHFPAGATAPVTVLLRDERLDFAGDRGTELVKSLTARLAERKDRLALADVRSLSAPLGLSKAGQEAVSGGLAALLGNAVKNGAVSHYVSQAGSEKGHVTRLELVLRDDPFDVKAFDRLGRLERAVRELLPEPLRGEAEVGIIGVTASMRDLRTVAVRDRTRIYSLVTASVFVVLVVLLRRVVRPLYLIASVVFGFLVTLGVSFVFFGAVEGKAFTGLDWTVPIFLFAVLVAVGADYNIFLVTRVDEEQRRHGPLDGVRVALARTGGIISSCGLIMAGTFSSLAVGGTLASMYQLGFALAFGTLLDTFLVRPVLVPAFLVMMNRRPPAAAIPGADAQDGGDIREPGAHRIQLDRR